LLSSKGGIIYMYSMTGFGSSKIATSELEGKIEIKTLNHKYLDIQMKGPRELFSLEEKIRHEISKKIKRGRVEIRFNIKFSDQNYVDATLNTALVKSYIEGLQKIQKMIGESEQPLLPLVSKLPDVFLLEQPDVDEFKLWEKVQEGVTAALDELIEMKCREGGRLKQDIFEQRNKLEELVEKISELKDRVTRKIYTRLKKRMEEFLNEQDIEENRIVQEAAIYSDKANIDEELVRMRSHINQIDGFLDENGPVGRKLDFVVQEMNREINTIASKANDEEISQLVIEAKSTVEKIREQVQNIE